MLENLTEDQYRFLVANGLGIALATQYKLAPKSLRNEFHYLPGILMVYYCFGHQANSLMLFSGISYLICKYTSWRHVHLVSMASSLAFLSYTHLNRQLIDYGGYVLDISGPFMIAVQKMTSMGFCLYDGGYFNRKQNKQVEISQDEDDNNNNNNYITSDTQPFCNENIMSPMSPSPSQDTCRRESNNESPTVISDAYKAMTDKSLNKPKSDRDLMIIEERKHYSIDGPPSLRDFLGYFFHFPSVLCGPIVYFTDHKKFTEEPKSKQTPPGKWWAVISKLTISVTCAILHLSLNNLFDVQYLRTDQFQIHTPVMIRFGYILVLTFLSRLKYYVAWHLGETISNASGLGFAGYDSNGKAKWDLLSNMELWRFETCLSMRDAILAWNKTTQTWLRRTAYDRVPRRFSVLATYTLSAVWHGFYPGYYMTFLSGALFTVASRFGRKAIRPLFQKGSIRPKVYDVITFIMTRLTIAYTAFPFVILDFQGSFDIYRSLYFSLHILGLAGVLSSFISKRVLK